jgi:hypothetical protein
MTETNDIITLWKELNVESVHFEFSCGGDSMNDTTIVINGKDGETIENEQIATYIDNEVYNNVEFYVNSDGHYQGEFGTVYITLDDDDETLSYNKSSQSEWTEHHESTVTVELSEDEANFVKQKVSNLNGSMDEFVVNYKGDLILTDKDEETLEAVKTKVEDTLNGYEPEVEDGEVGEWYNFTTNGETGTEIAFEGNSILVQITNEVNIVRDEE